MCSARTVEGLGNVARHCTETMERQAAKTALVAAEAFVGSLQWQRHFDIHIAPRS
jgi:hypothetical protein